MSVSGINGPEGRQRLQRHQGASRGVKGRQRRHWASIGSMGFSGFNGLQGRQWASAASMGFRGVNERQWRQWASVPSIGVTGRQTRQRRQGASEASTGVRGLLAIAMTVLRPVQRREVPGGGLAAEELRDAQLGAPLRIWRQVDGNRHLHDLGQPDAPVRPRQAPTPHLGLLGGARPQVLGIGARINAPQRIALRRGRRRCVRGEAEVAEGTRPAGTARVAHAMR
mmetsp:Transcript_79550/g.257654  ORF Transcript_79550/g.257654 Transcript_79550/m.257654 type:complete len:225 (+) Transcript_79550:188-862(+)